MTLTDPRLAYGSLPVLIWTAGADGTCDYLNERWSEFTGRPVAAMLGWAWLECVHPDDRERVAAEYSGAVAARGPVRLEPGIEFLEKPFSLDRLLRKVRQVLGADLSAEDATPWTQRSLV